MDYIGRLRSATKAHHSARQAAALAEARRDDVIREAHREGGLSARDIAPTVDLSFQRVATIIGGDLDRPARTRLHDAMRQVLSEHGNEWTRVHDLAREIYDRELYRRKDRGVIPPGQIRARASKYPELFEGSTDGTNRIRLRA
jgi:hypothetical protein